MEGQSQPFGESEVVVPLRQPLAGTVGELRLGVADAPTVPRVEHPPGLELHAGAVEVMSQAERCLACLIGGEAAVSVSAEERDDRGDLLVEAQAKGGTAGARGV